MYALDLHHHAFAMYRYMGSVSRDAYRSHLISDPHFYVWFVKCDKPLVVTEPRTLFHIQRLCTIVKNVSHRVLLRLYFLYFLKTTSRSSWLTEHLCGRSKFMFDSSKRCIFLRKMILLPRQTLSKKNFRETPSNYS